MAHFLSYVAGMGFKEINVEEEGEEGFRLKVNQAAEEIVEGGKRIIIFVNFTSSHLTDKSISVLSLLYQFLREFDSSIITKENLDKFYKKCKNKDAYKSLNNYHLISILNELLTEKIKFCLSVFGQLALQRNLGFPAKLLENFSKVVILNTKCRNVLDSKELWAMVEEEEGAEEGGREEGGGEWEEEQAEEGGRRRRKKKKSRREEEVVEEESEEVEEEGEEEEREEEDGREEGGSFGKREEQLKRAFLLLLNIEKTLLSQNKVGRLRTYEQTAFLIKVLHREFKELLKKKGVLHKRQGVPGKLVFLKNSKMDKFSREIKRVISEKEGGEEELRMMKEEEDKKRKEVSRREEVGGMEEEERRRRREIEVLEGEMEELRGRTEIELIEKIEVLLMEEGGKKEEGGGKKEEGGGRKEGGGGKEEGGGGGRLSRLLEGESKEFSLTFFWLFDMVFLDFEAQSGEDQNLMKKGSQMMSGQAGDGLYADLRRMNGRIFGFRNKLEMIMKGFKLSDFKAADFFEKIKDWTVMNLKDCRDDSMKTIYEKFDSIFFQVWRFYTSRRDFLTQKTQKLKEIDQIIGLIPPASFLVPPPSSLLPPPSSLLPPPSSLLPRPSSLLPHPSSLVPPPSFLLPLSSSLLPPYHPPSS